MTDEGGGNGPEDPADPDPDRGDDSRTDEEPSPAHPDDDAPADGQDQEPAATSDGDATTDAGEPSGADSGERSESGSSDAAKTDSIGPAETRSSDAAATDANESPEPASGARETDGTADDGAEGSDPTGEPDEGASAAASRPADSLEPVDTERDESGSEPEPAGRTTGTGTETRDPEAIIEERPERTGPVEPTEPAAEAGTGAEAESPTAGQPADPWSVRSIVSTLVPLLMIMSVLQMGSGTVLETFEEQLLTQPSLLILVPVMIGTAGNLGSIMSARLTTQFHLGTLELSPSNPYFRANVAAVFGLAATVFVLLAVSSWAIGRALGGSLGLGELLVISLVSGMLLAVWVVVVTSLSVYASYRFGVDPDDTTIPIVTNVCDVTGVLILFGVVSVVL